MISVQDKVREVVDSLVLSGTLFTALDVSNEVKKSLPLARHSEVRDIVRGLYNVMQLSGYGRTPIKVKLTDGTVVEALLYHHLSDSWDLDTKYDDQKRAQAAVNPAKSASVATAPAPTVKVVSPVPVAVAAPAVTVPTGTPVTVTNPKQLWDNLFTGVQLFPLK